jgi:uncharacterized protein YecT (DUF1311 family)
MNHNSSTNASHGQSGKRRLARTIAIINAIQRKAHDRRTKRDKQSTDKDALARYTRGLFVATCVIAGAGILTFGAALLQWNALRNTDKATHDLAAAAFDQAEATTRQVEIMQRQLDAADKQATAAIDASKTSRDALIAAERAWVGPRNARIDAAPTFTKDLDIIIDYQNSGREPAIETIWDTDVFTATDEEDNNGTVTRRIDNFIANCKTMWKPFQATVVYPSSGGLGGGYALTKTLLKESIDDDLIEGRRLIAISGCFVYRTVRTIHRSWFCYFYRNGKTKPAAWNICISGNGAD